MSQSATAALPPYSVKAMHYSKTKDNEEPEKELDRKHSLSFTNMDDILKNKLKIDTEMRSSITFKTEEEKNNTDSKRGGNEILITPFHLNADPQFRSTLPYLMVNIKLLIIIIIFNIIICIIFKK